MLYGAGIRLGDNQLVVGALGTAVCMFFVSQRTHSKKLSVERPRASAITAYLFTSILLQFACHVGIMAWAVRISSAVAPLPPTAASNQTPDPTSSKAETGAGADEPEFKPHLVNTVVFLLLLSMQASTFLSTIRGQPFLQSYGEQRKIIFVLLGMIVFALLLLLGAAGELAAALELVAVPATLKSPLAAALVGDVVAAFAIDRIAALLFPLAKGSEVYRRRQRRTGTGTGKKRS